MSNPGINTNYPPSQEAEDLRQGSLPKERCESEEAEVEDPEVVLPPGLREFRLSQADAEKLEHLLDDSGHPTHDGKEMPTADASILLKKNRTPNP